MKRILIVGFIASSISMLAVAVAIAQSAASIVIQPQQFRLAQQVPLRMVVSVPVNGQMVQATVPVTVAVSLDVQVSGGGVINLSANQASVAVVPAKPIGNQQIDSSGRQYTTEAGAGLRVDQVASKLNSLGMVEIMGTLTNLGQSDMASVLVAISLYDKAGGLMGTENTYATIRPLAPGQTSPFRTMLTVDDPSLVTSYKVQAQANR